MAFVGPHHGPKILGKNHQSTTKVTLNEPPIKSINRVFPQLPDLTFLYKIDITGFQNQQKKITSTGYWTHNTNPTLRFPAPLTTQPPRHLLNRRFMNWTLIISGLIEHDFKRVWKFEAGMDWQIGWVGKGAGILIVGLVLWVQYPVEAIFFCWFWNPVMSILYKNDRNVRSGNWGKTRLCTKARRSKKAKNSPDVNEPEAIFILFLYNRDKFSELN